MFESGVMDAPRTIHCDSFWDALVLRSMLEKQGVQVGRRDEGVVLSIVASGALDAIKTAVTQLSHEFPGSGPVVIEGEDRAEPAVAEREDRAEPAVAEREDRAEPAVAEREDRAEPAVAEREDRAEPAVAEREDRAEPAVAEREDRAEPAVAEREDRAEPAVAEREDRAEPAVAEREDRAEPAVAEREDRAEPAVAEREDRAEPAVAEREDRAEPAVAEREDRAEPAVAEREDRAEPAVAEREDRAEPAVAEREDRAEPAVAEREDRAEPAVAEREDRAEPAVAEREDRAEPAVAEREDRAEPAVAEREDRAEDADTAQFAAMEPLPAIPASSASGITEEVRAQPDIDVQPEPATAAPADHTLIPARPPVEQGSGRQTRQDEEAASPEKAAASPEKAAASPEKAAASPEKAAASPEKAQARPAKALTRLPKPEPPEAPASPPKAATPARMHKWLRLNWWIAVLVLVWLGLAAYGLLAVSRHAAMAPTRNGHRTGASTEVAIRDRAAAWVAGQVSRTATVSCDRVMCQAVEAHGIPAASVLELRPGQANPLRSSVIVVTAAVRSMVGSRLITADAPAAIASFGTGSRQISVREIYPQGAAAYAAALRKDIADRKANESSLLENPRVTAPSAARRQLQDGQVDSRLLLTLAQLASQWPLSIRAFDDRAPGASPGVPLRSADLAVTGDAAGQARQMSAFVHQLQGFFASARIRAVRLANGQDVVQIEFAAPSPLGVLNPRTP